MVDFTRIMLGLVNKKTYIPFSLVTIVKCSTDPQQIINRVSSSASGGYQRTIPKRSYMKFG